MEHIGPILNIMRFSVEQMSHYESHGKAKLAAAIIEHLHIIGYQGFIWPKDSSLELLLARRLLHVSLGPT